MTKQDALRDSVVADAVSRRKFGKTALAAGLGVGAGLVPGAVSSARAQALTDFDILNFALNLEYLEAEFYTVLTTGTTIDQQGVPITGTGTPGPTTGATRLNFGGDRLLEQTALELAYDERQHVLLLRKVLGSAAVAKPAINFAPATVTSVARFLQVARVLEDIGVSAYGGAAPLIQDKDILAAAVRIGLVEALHTGNIRYQVASRGVTDIGKIDAVDIVVGSPPQIGSRLISADINALTPVRTPSQVLSIAYGPGAPAGTTSGLLFPNGMNGTIRTV